MANYSKFSAKFVKAFESQAGTKEHSELLSKMLSEHEGGFKSVFVKSKQHKTTDTDAPKRSNWQAIWTSNENGCRSYPGFSQQLQSIEQANPTMQRFSVNKELRQWAINQGKYEEWQSWAKARLLSTGKPVPLDTKVETKVENVTNGAVETHPSSASVVVESDQELVKKSRSKKTKQVA